MSIHFLDSCDHNMLIVPPNPKPMLLECLDDAKSRIGFLPKGVVAMFVGAGGVGKTHLLGQLAISVATGLPWLGEIYPTIHCGEECKGGVFIGLGENQDDDIHRLLFKASQKIRSSDRGESTLQDASKRIATMSFCGQNAAFLAKGETTQYFREFKRRLMDKAPSNGWKLIILDPISRLMGDDAEKDNSAGTQFIALLEELAIDLPGNPTILCAHHVSKASLRQGDSQDQTASRGASALTDGVRWQASIARRKNGEDDAQFLTLKMTKSNFTKIVDAISLERGLDGFIEIAQSFESTPHQTSRATHHSLAVEAYLRS